MYNADLANSNARRSLGTPNPAGIPHLRTEFDPANIECGGSGHVVVSVADQEARADIDRPFACRLFQHARGRGFRQRQRTANGLMVPSG